ncbi:hypothetical protein ACFX2C_009085 [Malus domestica]
MAVKNLNITLSSRSCSWSVNRHRCFILIPPNSQLFILHAGFLGDRNKFGVGDEAIKCNMEVLPLVSPLDEEDIDLRVYRNYSVGLLPEAAFRSPVLLADSFQTRRQRERLSDSMTQLLCEEFNVPSLIIANSAVLTTLASCRTTALVVDW